MTIPHDIVLGIKNGSHKDFESFYNMFNGKLYNFVMKLSGGNIAIAEDIVQTSFVKLWETRELLDTDRNIITYICTIAKNTLINHYKKETYSWLYEDFILSQTTETDNSTENNIDVNFLENYVDSVVETLSPACKNIYILSRKEGLSNKKIAEKLSISEKTVENQITRALSTLRKHLKEYLTFFVIFIKTFL